MANKNFFTAAHIKYLLALKQLNQSAGIKSADIAKTLGLTRTSVHNMMDTFLEMNYITKQPGGHVYLTEYGLGKASAYEQYHHCLKQKLFPDRTPDATADTAICAFLAELSEQNLSALTEE